MPRSDAAGRDRPRRGAFHRGRRLCRLLHRFAAARAVTLRGRLRAARCRAAAQRAERSGNLADMGVEGRAHRARQRLLRQARARQNDVPRAAHDSVFSRRLGDAPRGRETDTQQTRASDSESAPQGMGNGHVGPAGGSRRERSRGIHQSDGRAAGGDDRGAERGRLCPEVHLHLGAGRRTVSRRAGPARESRDRGARNRALLSRRRRHDDSRRAGARDRPVAARSRARQPCVGRRRVRDDARARSVSAGCETAHWMGRTDPDSDLWRYHYACQ